MAEFVVTTPDGGTYLVKKKIGMAAGSTIYAAFMWPERNKEPEKLDGMILALRICKEEQSKIVLNEELTRSNHVGEHKNLCECREVFIDSETNATILVMQTSNWGSMRSLISRGATSGFSESCIVVILKEILNAVTYLHGKDEVHKKISIGNIFMFPYGPEVKLGFAASEFEETLDDTSSSSSTMPSSQIWEWGAAPEIYKSAEEYTPKADIWGIGITALELAYGKIQVENREGFEANIKKFLNNEMEPMKSRGFREMVSKCLCWNPEGRPTAAEVLNDPFFDDREPQVDAHTLFDELVALGISFLF